MTLLVCHLTYAEQILVSDRRLTSAATGKLIEIKEYKILQYCNPYGYQFAIGFTGLARFKNFRTMDWLLEILPKCFTEKTEFNEALAQFKTACANVFNGMKTDRELTRISFIFVGHVHHSPAYPTEPHLMIVSNNLKADGNIGGALKTHFDHHVVRRERASDPSLFNHTLFFGDNSAANKYLPSFTKLQRLLRRTTSTHAKLELCASFVRLVGKSNSSVGKDVLGLALRPGEMALAAEWPETKGGRETLPHLLFANGVSFTQASLPPSLATELSEDVLSAPSGNFKSPTISGGKMRFYPESGNQSFTRSDVTFPPGQNYKVEIVIDSINRGCVHGMVGGKLSKPLTTAGAHSMTIVAGSLQFMGIAGLHTDAVIDRVSFIPIS